MEAQKPSVSVADLNELCKQIAEQRVVCEEFSAKATEQNKILASLEAKAAAYLTELNQDNFKSPFGTVYKMQKWNFTLPKTPEAKAAFFSWLKEKGIADQYLTVHSASFNTLCRAEREAQAKQGLLPEIPGVDAPTLYESTGFRKA